jgi:hypothetical protein
VESLRWYVYHLVDPRTGEAFYVGKGTGSRVRAHEVEAHQGVRSAKCNRIRDIWRSGLPVERRIVKLWVSKFGYSYVADRFRPYGIEITSQEPSPA